jgi:gliding motility-associated-like protein
METNWNQLIERYLNNELSAEGKTAFEAELKQNKELQQEFELHKLTTEIIQRDSLRTLVKESGRWFHLKKMIGNSGIVLVIAGVLATAIYFFAVRTNETGDKAQEQEVLEQSLVEQMEESLAFENIDPEYFQFTGTSDVFLSESGVLLSLTEESFLLDGKAYKGEAVVQWQEAQTAAEIVKAGLSTKSGDELLETQGMFSLNAFTPEGKKLQLTDKGIYVQVPVDELKKDMKLFTGVPQKNGGIDWQNPVELERLPKPKDMAKMDLFPPRYEPKLNELKWFKEKTKRDSLYLSFEEENLIDSTAVIIEDIQMYNQPKMETPKRISESPNMSGSASISMAILPRPQDITYQVEGKQVPAEKAQDKVKWSFSVRSLGNNEAEVIATVTIKSGWEINALNLPKGTFGIPTSFKLKASSNFKLLGKPSEPKPILDHNKEIDEDVVYHVGTVQFKQKIRLISEKPFALSGFYEYQTCKMNSYCLPPFEGTFSLQSDGAENWPTQALKTNDSESHIPPSKVLAIWNKKFNGTNLATQDFEDRMKEIHETCSEKVFDVYANNLNAPLWELDQRVARMGYGQFQRFADEKVGKIQMDDVHQLNLAVFYEEAIKTLRETGKKNVEAALRKEEQWDNEVQDERQKEVLRKGIRASLNAQEEADFNLAHIAKQLQQVVGFSITNQTVASRDQHWPANLPRVYAKRELPVVVNIDRLTRNLLSSRKAVKVFTMDKVKTAEIQYAEFKANVESFKDFDRLYFYLFPKQVNSYERRDFVNGKLNHSLNDAIDYSGLAFGLNEEGFYIFEIRTLRATDFGSIKLQKVSEKQFETCLNRMNERRGVSPTPINDELTWLFKEKVNYQVQQRRRENVQFRNTVRPTIYSCLRTESAQADSTQAMVKPATVRNLSQNRIESNEDPSGMYLPNVFTPNDDGVNDRYFTKAKNISNFELKIYDETNRLVFKTTDLTASWDGKIDGRKAKEGFYAAILTGKEQNGENFKKSQLFELKR